jgi:ubiquinone/menaquinone biosynthesis C-methylase UbiE
MSEPWYRKLYEYFPDYDDEPYVQNTEQEVDFIERELEVDRGERILDVGCGTGRHTFSLAQRGYPVVGLDLSESMVRRGRARAREEGLDVGFVVGDARALPFGGSFDTALILCEGGFSLMETDAMDRRILEETARVLGPQGRLIMTAPHAAFMIAHESDEGAFNLVTLREGFEIETKDVEGTEHTLEASQRYYAGPELRWMLQDAGFESIQFFAVTPEGFSLETRPSRDHFEIGVVARLSE